MRLFLTLALLVCAPAPALAHGPAPTPLRVLQTQDGRPAVVLTNIGVAVRAEAPGAFDYVCPSLWGGLETPLATASANSDIFVLGADDLYAAAGADVAACTLLAAGLTDLDVAEVVGLATSDTETVLVTSDGLGSRILRGRLRPPVDYETFEVEGRINGALHTGDSFVFSGARPAPVLHVLTREGLQTTALAPPGSSDVQRITPRYAWGERIYFSAITDQGVELWRSDGEELQLVLSGDLSLHGPAAWCDGIVAVVDGALEVDPTAAPTCSLAPFADRQFQCLHETGGVSYVCENRVLHGLTADATEVVFELEQLRGPACGDGSCDQDWLHFGAEAGLVDPETFDAGRDVDPDSPTADAGADVADPGVESSPTPRGDSGCDCRVSVRPSEPWSWLRRR